MENKVIIPLVESSCLLPIVEFELGGEKQAALVDTGSESTLFAQEIPANEDFVLKGTNYVMSLVGLSGETSKKRIIGATAKLIVCDTFGNKQMITIEGMLTSLSTISEGIRERCGRDIKITAIIGSDFLKENDAIIDYGNNQLSVLGKIDNRLI